MAENTTIRKVAVLMISLGPKVAGQVIKRLPENLLEKITAEISEVNLIATEDKADALEEFIELRRRSSGVEFGGENSALEILEEALGKRQADSVLNRATGFSDMQGFDNLKRVDNLTVMNYLKNENPQTIALVLAYVDPRSSGPIIQLMPSAMQGAIAHRMATLDKPNNQALKIVEETISGLVRDEMAGETRSFGGRKQVAAILNEIDQESWLEIIDDVREIDDECATEIKNLMFVFEDMINLDDHYIQEILKEVKGKELATALKGTPNNIKEKIFKNMSKRAKAGIEEDMEYMGPIPIQEVEEAQQKIVSVVRRLMDEGVIVLGRGGGGASMVT